MRTDLLRDALKRRKARNFDSKGFLEEKESKRKSSLDSEELKEKTSVAVGDGVDEKILEDSRGSHKHSTDELAPTKKELRKVEGATGSFDEDVFDENTYKKLKKRKPRGIFERMQANLGQKMRGDMDE